jgi:hypothetical protein
MAYQTGDTILDDEYNTFATGSVGGSATDSANVNNIWGTGSGDRGYGQTTTVSAVSAGSNVTATQWSTLLSRITTIGSHQGTSLTAMTSPSAGDEIAIIGAISSNITSLHTNRLTAAGNGTTGSSNLDSTGNWTVSNIQEVTVTFDSADEARYYFNAGGNIQIDPQITGYTDDAKARSWNALSQMTGNLVFTAQGTSRTGGADTIIVTEEHTSSEVTLATTTGYYDLTTSYQTLLQRDLNTSGSPYISGGANNIKIEAKSNGTQGSNSDAGTVITFKISCLDASSDQTYDKAEYNPLDVMDGTFRVVLSNVPPSTTYLTSTWGTTARAQTSATAT